MNAKLFMALLSVTIMTNDAESEAALRRVPKVYNALITTDENLTSSQAFPVIQPTLHETGIAHYALPPFGPYGFASPPLVRLGPPLPPPIGFPPKEQFPYPGPLPHLPPHLISPYPGAYPQSPNLPTPPVEVKPQKPETPPTAPAEQSPPPASTVMPPPTGPQEAKAAQPGTSKSLNHPLPIPLNQYGLPPSLIPIRQYPGAEARPLPLPPYPFSQYPPVFYDPITGIRQPFLPPFDYLPTGPQYPLSNTIQTNEIQPSQPNPPSTKRPEITTSLPELTTEYVSTPPTTTTNESPTTDFENIKNGSKSEDSNVPDVPPPPIPTSAKAPQP
ncbi:vegetative cell wall protein gp1 [Glossina fuscipes]|uniref:Vegetative cell wall protein gp1 n=1 Tax=Glossina fuscipes TaxID=7396 RepID=A0A8U0WIY3_9MUSC|nr:vegetative cell wall protein gp1 [Glossina fuscipes]KAI9584712.1 hypothetical protein GQX74_006607 [Glossina fuscipes]